MIDIATVTAISSKYSIPPPILYALAQVGMGPGRDIATTADLDAAAQAVSTLFRRVGTWEGALSEAMTGDPRAYQSPTSQAGGTVAAIMGIAGARPSIGMDGFAPATMQNFVAGSRAFGNSIQSLSQLGGVVTPQHVTNWYQAAKSVRTTASGQYQQVAGRSSGAAPFGFDVLPYDRRYAGPEYVTEGFGDTSGPGGFSEMGNDIGLPHGTPLSAPISGTVKVVRPSNPNSNTGLTVYIVRPDGSRVFIGHMADTHLQDGQTVNAGDAIGTSGGVPGVDQYPGNSSGAHIEVGIFDAQGNLYDPAPVLQAAAQRPAPGGGAATPHDHLLQQAGFTGEALATARAVMLAESGGRADAQNTNTDGSVDRGIFQINNRYHPEVSDECAYNPECAAREAFRISNQGNDFSPWTTYTSGVYRQHTSDSNSPPLPRQGEAPPSPAPSPQSTQPEHVDPAAVGNFAGQLKAHGITPEHFEQAYPNLSMLRRRLMAANTSVDDVAPFVGLTPDQAQQRIMAQPHHVYPEHTVGDVHNALQTASLYSLQYLQRPPATADAARFVAARMGGAAIQSYYRDLANEDMQPSPTTKVLQNQPQPDDPRRQGGAQ